MSFLKISTVKGVTLHRGMNEYVSIFAEVWHEGFAHNAVKLCELHKKLV
jgi:hypothetical protein